MKPPTDTPSDIPLQELDALRAQLAAAEQRAAVAEAVAPERERVIQTQAMALRMLKASKSPTPVQADAPPAYPSPAPGAYSQGDPTDAPKRPWWRRE